MSTQTSSSSLPIVKLSVSRNGRKCPFGNDKVTFELRRGGCVCLDGKSGAGKTSLATYLAGLSSRKALAKLDIEAEEECQWDPSIPVGERCGVLFQHTTLLDELTVAGNLRVALKAAAAASEKPGMDSNNERDDHDVVRQIKGLLESVGLDYARDAWKRPTELSGGMGRRVSLALQLAQKKRVIVLDELFTGLDRDAAISVAKELVHLRVQYGTALLLISHEPDLAALVMDKQKTNDNVIVRLEPPSLSFDSHKEEHHPSSKLFFGTKFIDRFIQRLIDYVLWSLPLILLTFLACGLAISMVSADILNRIDVTDKVLDIVDKEVKPLVRLVTGEEPNAFTMMGIRLKVHAMMNKTIPEAKATLYASGMAKLFVLEVGPLLTALLLSGRIGGSYSGHVATMQATAQNKLLRTLGISPDTWTLWPAFIAAAIAAPFLTVVGTGLALILGGLVGSAYGIIDTTTYITEMNQSVFPQLRLRSIAPLWEVNSTTTYLQAFVSQIDLRTTFSKNHATVATMLDTLIEVATYPPIFHLLKAKAFIVIIMLVAEASARLQPNLTPRGVPGVITTSVVTASLLVVVADWAFSQLWLLRY